MLTNRSCTRDACVAIGSVAPQQRGRREIRVFAAQSAIFVEVHDDDHAAMQRVVRVILEHDVVVAPASHTRVIDRTQVFVGELRRQQRQCALVHRADRFASFEHPTGHDVARVRR